MTFRMRTLSDAKEAVLHLQDIRSDLTVRLLKINENVCTYDVIVMLKNNDQVVTLVFYVVSAGAMRLKHISVYLDG